MLRVYFEALLLSAPGQEERWYMIGMFKLKKESTEYENKSLRLPKELIDIVQKLADENDLSFNKVVIQCIEYAIDHMEE